MARKHKGMTVYMDQSVQRQLKQMVANMELTEKEATDVLKETLQSNANMIQNEINSELEKHVLTGETIQHAIIPEVQTTEMQSGAVVGFVDVGIKLSGNLQDMKRGNGGYASLLLDYGTPKKRAQKNPKRKYKKAPSEPVQRRFIGNAIRRGRKRWEQESQAEFERIVAKRLGE